MPYQRRLEELCLSMIIDNFISTFQPILLEQSLPPVFSRTIYERLCQNGGDEPQTRTLEPDIFIHSNTTSLQRIDMFALPNRRVLHKIGLVCKTLVDLDLKTLDDIPSRHILKLLPQMAQIQRLSLSNQWDCANQVAASIGKNCRQLIQLNLNSCTFITDTGIARLSACVKLEHLEIYFTRTTAVGCFRLLNRLPVLKVFKNDHDVFPRLKRQAKSKPGRTYSLKQCPASLKSGRDVAMMFTIFPKLTSLSVNNDTVLALHKCEYNVLFGGLQRLTCLDLMFIESISLRLVGRLCPKLEELKLFGCSFLKEIDGEDVSFAKLRRLVVDLMDADLRALFLQCRNVEEVEVSGCVGFKDDLISLILDENGFQNLRVLDVCSCDLISLGSVLKLLEMRNPLRKLSVKCCNIGLEDFAEIEKYVQRYNLDVSLD